MALLAVARDPGGEPLAHVVGEALVLDLLDRLVDEGEHEQALGLVPGDAARGEVEERVIVGSTAGRAVRAFDVVGVDLELGLGEELRGLVEQEALADLVAVGALGAGLDQDLALEDADRAAVEHLLEDLPALAVGGAVGDEDGVVVVEGAVADAGPRQVGGAVRAGELDDMLVAGEAAVGGQGEGLERRALAEPGEERGEGGALVVAALGADVVEARAVGDLDLGDAAEPRRGGAGFEQGEVGPFSRRMTWWSGVRGLGAAP
jgi:hypothetical protein